MNRDSIILAKPSHLTKGIAKSIETESRIRLKTSFDKVPCWPRYQRHQSMNPSGPNSDFSDIRVTRSTWLVAAKQVCEMSGQRKIICFHRRIDEKDVCGVLHDGATKLDLYSNAYFANDHVMKAFFERTLQLKSLSAVYVSQADSIGDFWRLVYRRSTFKTLRHLYLNGISPCSRASILFAKYSSWYNLDVLCFDWPRNEIPATSAYFIMTLISTCTVQKELHFLNFRGCGLESFALANRVRNKDVKLHSELSSTLRIPTSENRANLRHLFDKAYRASGSEIVMLTASYSQKMRRSFKQSEWKYLKSLDRRNIASFGL